MSGARSSASHPGGRHLRHPAVRRRLLRRAAVQRRDPADRHRLRRLCAARRGAAGAPCVRRPAEPAQPSPPSGPTAAKRQGELNQEVVMKHCCMASCRWRSPLGAPAGLRPTIPSPTPRPWSKVTQPKSHLGRPDHRPEGRDAGKTIVYRRRRPCATAAPSASAKAPRKRPQAARLDRPRHRRPGLRRRAAAAPEPGDRARSPTASSIGGFDSRRTDSVEEAAKQGIAGLLACRRRRRVRSPARRSSPTSPPIPMEVAEAAASYAVADSDGKAGVVIFTDCAYEIAIAKSDAHGGGDQGVRRLQGALESRTRRSPTSRRACRSSPRRCCSATATKWTHALGINDLYFDFMAPSLASAGIAGDGTPHNISAGDGSEVAFQRIRARPVPGRHRRRAAAPAGLADRRRAEPRLRRREASPATSRRCTCSCRPISSSTAGRRTSTTRTTAIATPT